MTEVTEMQPSIATTPLETARQQAEGIVRNGTSIVNVALQERIDELLNLQSNISRSGTALMHYIGEYFDRCHEAIATADTIKSEIEAMASPFSKSPRPP